MNLKSRTIAVAAMGCMGLGVLAGCSVSTSSDTPSASPTSSTAEVTKDATYSDVTARKTAAVSAGLSCPDFMQTDDAPNASQSGTCGDAVLAIYASEADQDKTLEAVKNGTEKQVVLVGPNWTVTYDGADSLQAMLGGVIVEQIPAS